MSPERWYLLSIRGAIWDPLVSSATAGLLMALLVGSVAALDPVWRAEALRHARIGFLAMALPFYIWRIGMWSEALRMALSGAQEAEEPPQPEPVQIYPKLMVEGPTGWILFDWDSLTVSQWRALLQSTAAVDLIGKGKPFSRGKWEVVRYQLIMRGLAYWQDPYNHALGWRLKASTRRAISKRIT